MVEAYLGRDVFRDAVASYLKKYSYANAAAEDFWNEVTRVSGKPVDRLMKSFVDQPGAPVLSITSRCMGSSTEIGLKQERFSGTAGTPVKPQVWTLPVCLKAFQDSPARCEMITRAEQTLTVPGCASDAFVNAGSLGYFFSDYTPETIRAFARRARGTLSAAERLGLLGDEWWMVRAGRHELADMPDRVVVVVVAHHAETEARAGVCLRRSSGQRCAHRGVGRVDRRHPGAVLAAAVVGPIGRGQGDVPLDHRVGPVTRVPDH